MKIKHGVGVIGLKPEALLGIMIAANVYEANGYEFVLTSCEEGKHSKNSRHYLGMAFDCRTRDMPVAAIPKMLEKLKEALGSHYLVLFEKNHFHISYKPQR